jgi:hypothetical protein
MHMSCPATAHYMGFRLAHGCAATGRWSCCLIRQGSDHEVALEKGRSSFPEAGHPGVARSYHRV